MAVAIFASCRSVHATEDGAPLDAPVFRGLRVGPASSAGGDPTAPFLLAQVPADERTAPAPSAVPARDEGPAAGDASRGIGWSLAPVRWGGKVASELRVTGISGIQRQAQRVDSAEVIARTFIWQPWFIQLSGGLGVLRSHQLSSRGEGGAALPASQSDSSALTGHGTLVVFPMSRFPFQARAERTDSRTSEAITAQDYTTTRVGVRQDYRPERAMTNYSVSADRSVVDSASSGRDTLEVWEARVTGQSGSQNYHLAALNSRNWRDRGDEADIDRVNLSHTYREGARLTVSSLASADRSVLRRLDALLPTEDRSRLMQFNSQATWRPATDSPWYLSGGARFFRTEVENQGVAAETRTSSANIGANYRMNSKLTLTGNASVAELVTDTSRDVLTSIGTGITYTPGIIPVGAYSYNRSVGATVSRQTGGAEGDRSAATVQFDHGLTRSVVLDGSSTLGVNLGQGVSVSDDTLSDRTDTLLHTAGISWAVSPSGNSQAYTSLSAADSRRRGPAESDFQLVNLQLTGQYRFSRFAQGAANFTAQASRTSSPLVSTDGYDTTAAGTLSYQHTRAFGVPGLSYTALYSINESQFVTRQQGNLEAPPDRENQFLEQRLDYNIGRLETRLLGRIAETDGMRHWLVFLRVTRRFGVY